MSQNTSTIEQRKERSVRVIVNNKKALHDYFVIQRIEAGIVLTGTEVKSLRGGKLNIKDAYVAFPKKDSDEMFLLNLHISPYDFGNRENHEPLRQRKLLVKHKEAIKMRQAIQEKGLTIVPLSVYFSGAYVKVELGIVKGKKHYDKRSDIKEREIERDLRRGDD